MTKTAVEEIEEIQSRHHSSDVYYHNLMEVAFKLADRIDKLEQKQKINDLKPKDRIRAKYFS